MFVPRLRSPRTARLREEIARRLPLLRLRRDRLKITTAARAVGVSRFTWGAWERGGSIPAEHLPAVAEVLGTTVADLLAPPAEDEKGIAA